MPGWPRWWFGQKPCGTPPGSRPGYPTGHRDLLDSTKPAALDRAAAAFAGNTLAAVVHASTTTGYVLGRRQEPALVERLAQRFDRQPHACTTTCDDPTRRVPNPAKKKAHQHLLAARARYDRDLAATDAALLDAVTPPQGQAVLITNADHDHDQLTVGLRNDEAALDTAQHAHRAVPARVPPGRATPASR